MSIDNVYDLYASLAPLMSDEHREYIDNMLNGQAQTDPLLDLEMFFRVVNIYALQAVKWSMDEGKVTKDVGAILGEVRQGATAIESMRNKRKEEQVKVDDEGRMADPTSRPALPFLEGLDREFTKR
jgi:hypothetical protein